jgi:hypothetical protein
VFISRKRDTAAGRVPAVLLRQEGPPGHGLLLLSAGRRVRPGRAAEDLRRAAARHRSACSSSAGCPAPSCSPSPAMSGPSSRHSSPATPASAAPTPSRPSSTHPPTCGPAAASPASPNCRTPRVDQRLAAGNCTCWPGLRLRESSLRADRAPHRRCGGAESFSHALWRPSGPGPGPRHGVTPGAVTGITSRSLRPRREPDHGWRPSRARSRSARVLCRCGDSRRQPSRRATSTPAANRRWWTTPASSVRGRSTTSVDRAGV